MVDGKFYLQFSGASMGAKFSPFLANLFMSAWEESWFSRIRWYDRYIDGGWEGTQHETDEIAVYINCNNMQLRITHTFEVDSINFLDVSFSCNLERVIVISPYRKATATNSIPSARSCHPLTL